MTGSGTTPDKFPNYSRLRAREGLRGESFGRRKEMCKGPEVRHELEGVGVGLPHE